LHDYALQAGHGDFILTGHNAILSYTGPQSYLLQAGIGHFIDNGHNVILLANRIILAGIGDYSLTGHDASLLANRSLMAEAGNFGLSGHAAYLLISRSLFAGIGIFLLTGHDAIMTVQSLGIYELLAGRGSFILDGRPAILIEEERMSTRTITGTIRHNDDTPWAGGIVKFRLMEAFETATEVYPKETHAETLDAAGQFSITLAVPDTGTAHYFIITPDGAQYECYIEDGPPTDLMTLLLIAGSEVSQDAVQTLIDANNVMAITNVNTTYTVLDTDEWIRCDGTFTVTLPPATGSGECYVVMNVGTGIITVAGDGADTINGEATATINSLDSLLVVDVAANIWDAR
jgi:hypothetical protein